MKKKEERKDHRSFNVRNFSKFEKIDMGEIQA